MIREYEEKDSSELLEAWYSASQVAHPFLDEDFFEQERRNIAAVHLPNAETWVYELDGVVVGFIALIGNEVGAIFVDSKFHGQGICRALMDKARSLREVLELDVFKDNLVHCYHSFCSPGPLWAAVKANKFAVATVPHKGARLRN